MNEPATHISLDHALAILRQAGRAWCQPAGRIALANACGHVLSEDIHATIDLPPFDNAAMDGYALRRAEAEVGALMPLAGVTLAGQSPVLLPPGHCQRITTGAPLPVGADTVVIKENAGVQGARVVFNSLPGHGANVRRAGEDYSRGALALARGCRLTPPRVGLLASMGISEVPMNRCPRIQLFSTGDELILPSQTLAPGKIYDSNTAGLAAVLHGLGIDPVGIGHIPDRRDVVRRVLSATDDVDLILTCGGVSAGETDLLPAALAKLGEVLFWKVRIKPGMPFLFGRMGKALFCGLPGNPVSALVTWLVLVKPLLDAMAGTLETPPELWAQLDAALIKDHARSEYRRGSLRCTASGQLHVSESAFQGSAMQRGLVEADVLIELPGDRRQWMTGDLVRVHRMPWT